MMKTVMSALLLALLAAAPAAAAGAFAVDAEEGQKAGDEGYGIGWGNSREAAGRAALRKCSEMGNENCKVVARFDTCGAYVANRTTYGVGWGRTEAAAQEMAFDKCPTCKLVLAECE